ncbi:YgbK domain protein, partial [Klebsiella pneumoniae UHKPC 52]
PVAAALAAVNDPAVRYVVLDALSEQDLLTQGVALREMKLVSGGSGLAIGLARDWAQRHGARGESAQAGMPLVGGRSGGGALGLLLGDDQQPGGGLSSTGPRPRRRLKRLLYRSGELRQDAD